VFRVNKGILSIKDRRARFLPRIGLRLLGIVINWNQGFLWVKKQRKEPPCSGIVISCQALLCTWLFWCLFLIEPLTAKPQKSLITNEIISA
jgi:hypothetical protein